MRSAVILLVLIFEVTEAAKVTPMILACTAQSEERLIDEPSPELKDAIMRLTARVKVELNRYMVDKCASLKSCLICPLEIA